MFSTHLKPCTQKEQGIELGKQGNVPVANDSRIQKTRTTPYRTRGNSVSERVRSAMQTTLAMSSTMDQSNWTTLLQFAKLLNSA